MPAEASRVSRVRASRSKRQGGTRTQQSPFSGRAATSRSPPPGGATAQGGAVVYDSQPGAADTANPTALLRGGNIKIRKQEPKEKEEKEDKGKGRRDF